jgi:hypothetical protein
MSNQPDADPYGRMLEQQRQAQSGTHCDECGDHYENTPTQALYEAGAQKLCSSCLAEAGDPVESLPLLSWDYRAELRGSDVVLAGRVMGEDIREAFEAVCDEAGIAGIDVALFHVAEGD